MATCPKCKYEWQTRARGTYVTCPNCHRKFQRPATVIEPVGPPVSVAERCDICGQPANIVQPCRIDGEAAFLCPECLGHEGQ